MKKLMIMVAAVLMLVVATVPAFAQSFEFDQEASSGDISQVYQSSVSGDGSAVATDADFFANTGNVQSQEFFASDSFNSGMQYASEVEEEEDFSFSY